MNLKNQVSVRIKDIAKMANVSVGTVDRVLHERGRVSEEAYKRVQEVLKSIDYKPNFIARSLGRAKQLRIIALIPNPEFDPYWLEVQVGIQQAREEWIHYGVTIAPYLYRHDGKDSMETVANEALETNPDGFVIGPIFQTLAVPVIEKLRDKQIPFVLINSNLPELKPLSFIGQDLFQSGVLAARLMSSEIRHQKSTVAILHVGEDVLESVYLLDKEKGFRDYFEKTKKSLHAEILSHNITVPIPEIEEHVKSILNIPNLEGIYVTTSKALGPIASLLEKHPRKSEITLIGYDMLEANLHYLKEDVITFLINQNPKRQPIVGISHLANNLLFRKSVPPIELFPLEIIAKQNIESYLASSIH
jgi:LacI family transcriptional regulator